MKVSLTPESKREIVRRLRQANRTFAERYPGEVMRRQPVHTVYGGAHLFKSDSAQRLGALALRSLESYAPNFTVFAKAAGLPGSERLSAPAGGIPPCHCRRTRTMTRCVAKTNPSGWRTSFIHGS